MWMRLYVDSMLGSAAAQGSPGIEELRWLAPVRPGDTLHGRLTVLETTPSERRPDRGTIRIRGEMVNQDGVTVLSMVSRGHFARKLSRMSELGLFPLGIVLLPSEQIPLHIFEERYQELIGECLAEEREFGLIYADDDGLREIGTLAAVTEVLDRFDDGRLNVVVEGGERFRLLELTEGRSFQTGLVEPIEDENDVADPEDSEHALELFHRLVELTGAEVEEPRLSADQLSFELAGRFEFAPDLKQKLLQLTSERERMHLLAELLAGAATAVEREREIAERAHGNGKVDPRP